MNTHQAIKTGHIDLVKERIETRQIHVDYTFGGLNALHLAVMYGQTVMPPKKWTSDRETILC